MSAPIWKGYIISVNENSCTVLSESNKLTYVLPLIDGKHPTGPTMLTDELMVDIFSTPIVGKKLFIACKGYEYDILRGAKRHRIRRAKEKEDKSVTGQ